MIGLQLHSAGKTDKGQTRPVNEDTILNYTGCSEAGGYYGLYIVCDGLGGHQAGDVASRTAVQSVVKELRSILPPLPAHHINSADINQVVWTAVQRANEEICYYSENNNPEPRSMGTTLTLAVIINDTVHMAHVGDSRLYLFRDGKLEQLTRDHTMAAVLAEAGQISEDEIADHPRQNILTRALGRQKTVEVDMMELPLIPGDTLLLCSDGFWKAFKGNDTLERRLRAIKNTDDACQEFVAKANEMDGSDNISLIMVTVNSTRPAFQQQFSRQIQRAREIVAQ